MFFLRILPGIAWAFFIFILCGLPSSNTGSFNLWDIFSIDKLLHFGVFSLLSLILIVSFKRQFTFQNLRLYATIYATTFALLYGILLEYLQMTYVDDRSAEWLDVLANAVGAFNGIVLFRIIYGNPIIKAS